MTPITIPNKVTKISDYAFQNMGITSIDIPANISWGYDVFGYNNHLQEVKFPKTMKVIPYGMFKNCTSLKTITLPNNLLEIKEYAFQECSQLSKVVFNNYLKTIGYSCFYKCSSLQQVSLPEGLETIGYNAFYESGLSSITIPSTVTTCDRDVFQYCYNLTSVIWESALKVPDLTSSWLSNNKNLLVYVPEGGSSAPENRNVIYGTHAPSITLTSEGKFNCPRSFTTDAISYTLTFPNERTTPGESRNWKSIVLPFTPTSIVQKSENKLLAPFNANVEGAYPFWLRELTSNGFVNVTELEANHPYIISMPNNEQYQAEYNITGEVVFSADNSIVIPATPELPPSVGPNYSFCAAYATVPKDANVWALNEKEFSNNNKTYKLGSVFVADQRDVRPFEAYVIAATSRQSILPISSKAATRSAHVVGPIPSIEDM